MSFETNVLFNATISFRDKEAAARFLQSLGVVVEQSIAVFHSKTQRHATLENELHNVSVMLHHFEDSIEPGDQDRDIAQSAAAASADNIQRVLRVLREGSRGEHGWSDEQRLDMATHFKTLFEHLVVLMQLSEAQQAKSLVKNIRLTVGMLHSVQSSTGRAVYLHNQNLKNALPVLIRAADNRAQVVQDQQQKTQLEDIRRAIARESSSFCDWIDANETASESLKRDRGLDLERALERFLAAVQVRIASTADFGYKYLNRQKIDNTVDNLLAAAKSGNKAQVVDAAKALTEVVREAEKKDLDDDSKLKQETRELLTQAQLALNGTENQLDLAASRMKQEVAEVTEKEQEIKGKPLYGQLPSAIQSMAALLKSREAQQSKPKMSEGKTAYGSKKPDAPQTKEVASKDAPAMNVIAQVHRK